MRWIKNLFTKNQRRTSKDKNTEKYEGWINIYRNEDGISWLSPCYFVSKEEAEKEGKCHTCRVTTIKIEWEE